MKITYKGQTKECKYYKGLKWNKPLTSEMLTFQKETGKNPVRGGVITGTFEYWIYWDPKKKQTVKPKSKPKIGEIYINSYSKKEEVITPYLKAQIDDYIKIKKKNPLINKNLTKDFFYWQSKEMTWDQQMKYNKVATNYNKKHKITEIQTVIINKKTYVLYDNIYDINNKKHNIDHGLVRKLEKFQKETNKNPIRNNKITGLYLDWYKKTYYPKNRTIEDKNIQYRNKLIKHIAIEDMEFEGISQDKIYGILQSSNINRKALKPIDIPENILKYNQKELKKKFKTHVVLYKGIGVRLYKTKIMVDKHLGIIINGKSKNCISWTTNPNIAFDWCHRGYIIKAKIPIKHILLSYYGSYYLREVYEYEFIVTPHILPMNSYIVFKNDTNNNIEFNKFKKKCIQTKIG